MVSLDITEPGGTMAQYEVFSLSAASSCFSSQPQTFAVPAPFCVSRAHSQTAFKYPPAASTHLTLSVFVSFPTISSLVQVLPPVLVRLGTSPLIRARGLVLFVFAPHAFFFFFFFFCIFRHLHSLLQ